MCTSGCNLLNLSIQPGLEGVSGAQYKAAIGFHPEAGYLNSEKQTSLSVVGIERTVCSRLRTSTKLAQDHGVTLIKCGSFFRCCFVWLSLVKED